MQFMQNNELFLHCLNRDYSKISLFAHNNKNDKLAKDVFSEALCFCAYFEIIDVMDKLIEYGASVEYKDCNLCAPIHWASLGGRLGSIKYLFSKGATPLPRNKMWQTPIHILAAVGSFQSIEFISQLSNNLRSADRRGWSVVHYACFYGSLQTLELLVKIDFSLEENDKRGFKPLHLATARGHVEIVHELLEYGVNVNAKTAKGLTALHLAILYKQERIFEILLSKGASVYDVTDDGNTAFHFAFLSESEHLVERIYSHDISEVQTNKHKQTPFHTICMTSLLHEQRIKLLKNANFSEKDESGRNILHYLAFAGDHRSISRWLDETRDLCHADVNGWLPLHYSVQSGQLDVIELMLDANPNEIDCITNFGETLLHIAAGTCGTDVISYLISKGCCPNSCDKQGRSPLHFAAFLSEDTDILDIIKTDENIRSVDSSGLPPIFYAVAAKKMKNVKFFLEQCPDLVSYTDSKGRGILHYCSHNGMDEIIKHLMNKGCLNEPDNSGFTPLHYAVHSGHIDTISELTCEIEDATLLIDRNLLILMATNPKCSDIIHELFGLSSEDEIAEAACSDLSPLFYATQISTNPTLEKFFTFFKLSQDYFDKCVSNPLHYAVFTGNNELVEILLSLFPDFIDSQNEELSTPLMIAAAHGHVTIIELLIKANCNMDLQGAHGYTALHYAIVYQKIEAAQKLIDECAKTNIRDMQMRTPLFLACIIGLSDIIPYLLEGEADPELLDSSGFTALHWAALKSAEECVEILLTEIGSHLIFVGNSFSPLHCSVISDDEESSVHIFTKLIQSAVGSLEDEDEVNEECDDPNTNDNIIKIQALVDDDGRNPLHYAIIAQNASIVECICQNHIFCPNVKDVSGYTPLMLAAIYGSTSEILELLVELNPDFSLTDNHGNTALVLACEHKNTDVASYLVSKMTVREINICNKKALSALHSALRNKLMDIVDLLVKRDANPLVRDESGQSSITHVAMLDVPKKTIVRLLEEMVDTVNRNGDNSLAAIE